MDDFDDDLTDADDWMDMTDAELAAAERRQDAELDNLMREHCARLDAMTLPQRVAYHRGSWLRIIRANRRRLADLKLARVDVINEILREGIRKGRRELLKLRIWRETGTYPGEA
jgi:hypothetical protein